MKYIKYLLIIFLFFLASNVYAQTSIGVYSWKELTDAVKNWKIDMSILEEPTVVYFKKDTEKLTKKYIKNFKDMLKSISPATEELTGSVATGENAVVVGCRQADIIVGPIGIIVADALLGEVSEKMAQAINTSDAKKVLIPLNKCDVLIAGW